MELLDKNGKEFILKDAIATVKTSTTSFWSTPRLLWGFLPLTGGCGG
jgi:hypothetical protein